MLTAKEIEKLRELRRLMTFEPTKFAELWDDPERNPLPKREADVDAFIRERTRIFRETWILPVLDELLATSAPTCCRWHAGGGAPGPCIIASPAELKAPKVDAEGVCEACEAMPDGADGRAPFCRYHRTNPTVPT